MIPAILRPSATIPIAIEARHRLLREQRQGLLVDCIARKPVSKDPDPFPLLDGASPSSTEVKYRCRVKGRKRTVGVEHGGFGRHLAGLCGGGGGGGCVEVDGE